MPDLKDGTSAPRGAPKPWHLRNAAEDIAEANRQENERMDAHLNHPSYLQETREVVEAQLDRLRVNRPETIDSALYPHETHTPSRPLTNWERRRGIRSEEEDLR